MHMKLSYLAAGLLCSSVLMMMSDAGGSGGGELPKPTLELALVRLDPQIDAHWTQGGDPLLAHLEEVTGLEVSRDDVDKLTHGLKRSDDWKQELADTVDLVDPDDAQPAPVPVPEPATVIEEEEAPPAAPRKSALDSGRYRADGKALGVTVAQMVYLRSPTRSNGSAVVTEVHDNGEVDVELDGGEAITGVQHVSVIKQLPADAPERNLDAWDFSPAA